MKMIKSKNSDSSKQTSSKPGNASVDQDCIFCKIIDGKIPARALFSDENIFAFLDIRPSAPGHSVIIPKKHGASILDYSEKELGMLMHAVKKTAAALEKSLGCDSITIGINHLERDGVHHLHIHLIPRWHGDGGHALQGVVSNPTKEDLATLAEKIKKYLK